MKITKFVHSCLLVEMPEPINRTALFDPGAMSEGALNIDTLEFLDDIIITHGHGDHFHMPLIQKLVAKFPDVHITATPEVVERLVVEGITASSEASAGITFFDAPHEDVSPIYPQPQNIGVHYLDLLTDPGDSHVFSESKTVLALPVTGPWGGMIKAAQLALELQPRYIIPIHDWHWSDDARNGAYDTLEELFNKHDITFIKAETGTSYVIDL